MKCRQLIGLDLVMRSPTGMLDFRVLQIVENRSRLDIRFVPNELFVLAPDCEYKYVARLLRDYSISCAQFSLFVKFHLCMMKLINEIFTFGGVYSSHGNEDSKRTTPPRRTEL